MTRNRIHALLALTALTTLGSFGILVRADIIELTDGRKINGSVSSQGANAVIKGDDGTVITVAKTQLARITLTTTVTPAQAADAEWTRIAPLIKKADDIQSVIKLHEDYLAKFPDGPKSPAAKDALAAFKKLAEGDVVKFRGQWMARAQVDVKIKQWADDAKPALDLYLAGKLKEAAETVKPILLADEQNPDALTIAGLTAYRLSNLQQAKTYFTQLSAADPTSVLAENNLAVIAFQQKQYGEEILDYDKALQIKSDNRLLLDNIAEAINSYSLDKGLSNYKALVKAFEFAETSKETEMAKSDQVRWGSTWVTKDQMAKIKRYLATAHDQEAKLEAQGRAGELALATIETQEKQVQNEIDARTADVNFYSSQMILQQTQPQTLQGIANLQLLAQQRDASNTMLLQAQNQLAQLEGKRLEMSASLQEIDHQLQQVKTSIAAVENKYTGVQRVMDIGEGENPGPPAAVTVAVDGNGPPTVIITVPTAPTPLYMPVPSITPVNQPQVLIINTPRNQGNPGGGGRGRGSGGPPPPNQTQPGSSPPASRP